MLFFAAGMVLPIDASEVKKIIVEVVVGNSKLLCLGKKDIQNLGELGIVVNNNEPCFPLSQSPKIDWRIELPCEGSKIDRTVIEEHVRVLIEKMKPGLPLSCCIVEDEKKEQKFKEVGAVICSVAIPHNEGLTYEVRLQEQGLFFNNGVNNLIKHLRSTPDYYPEDEGQLIADGILAKTSNGKIVHGPKGYFSAEIDNKGASFSYLSYLKVPAIGLFISYVLWVLYNKSH